MERIEFKRITSEDKKEIDKIVKIEEEIFGKNGGADYWLIKAFVRYGLLLVIKDGDEIISIAEYMATIEKKELFLYGFLTREKFRGKGYGRKLIKHSEKTAKNKGYTAISLTVDPENLRAFNFYKKIGYEIIEFQKDEYGDGIHRYLMKKSLV
ncbi:MAG: GNAT family N-acetyltransferase [Fusobacteriaceae bacterium]